MLCFSCKKDGLVEKTYERLFRPNKKKIRVFLSTLECGFCKSTQTPSAMHDRNLAALAARASQYGDALTGESILAFRRKHLLTSVSAARLLGLRTRDFTRYENEKSYPDEVTNARMKLAMGIGFEARPLAEKS